MQEELDNQYPDLNDDDKEERSYDDLFVQFTIVLKEKVHELKNDFKENVIDSKEIRNMLLFRTILVIFVIQHYACGLGVNGNNQELDVRELIRQKGGQFTGMFLWSNLIWIVFRTFDSKLIQNPEKFTFIENIPPKWREIQNLRNYLRIKSRRDKPQSYLFDFVVIGMVWQFVQAFCIICIPFVGQFSQAPKVETSYRFTQIITLISYQAAMIGPNFPGLKFEHLDICVFLLRDGYILPQITALYLFDQRLAVGTVLTCFPVLAILFNYLVLEQINSLQTDKALRKLTLVSLIGRHDSLFLFVMFSGMITFFAAFDTLQRSWYHILYVLVYVFYGSYRVFNQLMTTKDNANEALILQSTRKISIAAIMLYFYANL